MLSDPICALATPPGRSAVALIRLAGRGSFEIARRVLGLPSQAQLPRARVATLHNFYDELDARIDRGLVILFPGPASYTGEDMVEFTCHGGLLVPAQLLGALQSLGARLAERGEFTRRALQNGKLDLVQAEAVADLVEATAPAQGRAALSQLEGSLSRRIEGLRADLIDTVALFSYEIDFPEEDDGPVDRRKIQASLDRATASIQALLDRAPVGERLRNGALVVFAGRPNVGKSSLFNALLGRERALVSEIPGTTRDTVEAPAEIDGWPVRLADTAGLRDSDDRIERLGIEVSRRYLDAADLVLLCVEAGRALDPGERVLAARESTLLVRTKSDLLEIEPGELGVSAVTGAGLGELCAVMSGRLFGSISAHGDLEPLLTRQRHRAALEGALAALQDAVGESDPSNGDVVLAAHHVRRAITGLDELIGIVDVEEVLGRVFGTFCVGK